MHDSDYCFWHDPEHAEEAKEARRLGGLRKRKERAVAAAFDLECLDSVAGLRRLLEIASVDLVTLDNGVQRNRAIIGAVGAGAKLLLVGDFEERLEALERAIKPRELTLGRRQ
jgi:hypothetical protein